MTYIYRYTGDLPTAFINLERPWEPSKGDLFESSAPIAHPLLELVVEDVVSASESPESLKEPEPVETPELIESTVDPDDVEEN